MQDESKKEIIINHRVKQLEPGRYQGQIKLVDPETGEAVHVLEPQTFNRCHEMYASYKLLNNSIRFIADHGYNSIILDTNVKRFAGEIESQESGRTLQQQLTECCIIHGIDELSVM
jgi:hypothetical protein